MQCDVCDGKNKENILYEDDKIIVALSGNPSTSGHVQIFSKEHYTIMEHVPEDVLGPMAIAANKVSMLLFEALKVHGTNILVQNGVSAGQTVPHFSMHIIPRRTDDGLKLDWEMKQASNESLDSMQRIITEGMSYEEPKEPTWQSPAEIVANTKDDQPEEQSKDSTKTSNWVKNLERIP